MERIDLDRSDRSGGRPSSGGSRPLPYSKSLESSDLTALLREYEQNGNDDEEEPLTYAVTPEDEEFNTKQLEKILKAWQNREAKQSDDLVASDILTVVRVQLKVHRGQHLGFYIEGVPVVADGTIMDMPTSMRVTSVNESGLLQRMVDQTLNGQFKLPSEQTEVSLISVKSSEGRATGLRGISRLQAVLTHMSEKGEELILDLACMAKFKLKHKGRSCDGTALHVAAISRPESRQSEELLWNLLAARAPPDQEFHFKSRGDPGCAQAIHLAAGVGNLRHISLLCKGEGDPTVMVNACSKVKGMDNVTPLHEASMYQLVKTAMYLLQKRADVNCKNVNNTTPLHLAAKHGNERFCELLKSKNADLQAEDKNFNKPVHTAVESGKFAFDKLHILMDHTFEDLLMVSELCTSVAAELVRDPTTGLVAPAWQKALLNQATKEHPVGLVGGPKSATEYWMEIMNLAPIAGEDILDVLTIRPKAQNDNYNAIPKGARIPDGVNMLCEYVCAEEWEWNPNSKEVIDWQDRLCPGVKAGWHTGSGGRTGYLEDITSRACPCLRRRKRSTEQDLGQTISLGHKLSRKCRDEDNSPGRSRRRRGSLRPEEASKDITELVPIKVKQLKLPGIINPDVMAILAFTTNHNILLKPAGQAIISYAWDHVARFFYITNVFYQAMIICMLGIEVGISKENQDPWARRSCWSAIFVFAHQELIYECWEMLGFVCYIDGGVTLYFTKGENYCNWISISLLVATVYLTYEEGFRFEEYPILLSILVLIRWFQITWSCRAFEWAGQKILPIMSAFFSGQISGILTVTFCMLFAFLHGALALELGRDPGPELYGTVLGGLKLLLLGDGDGIDATLALGGRPEAGTTVTFAFLIVATVIFCVCVLNLFIAVHGEAYDQAQEKARTSFLQERAAICLQCLLRPSWPPACFPSWRQHHRLAKYFVLVVVALAAWAALLREPEVHVMLPTSLLLTVYLFGDSLMVQPPWDKTKADSNYLWICHRKNLRESRLLTAAQENGITGRLEQQKLEQTALYKKLSQDVSMAHSHIMRKTENLGSRVEAMENRLNRLTTSICGLAATVNSHCGALRQPPVPSDSPSFHGSQ